LSVGSSYKYIHFLNAKWTLKILQRRIMFVFF
jgi:hypothetical protein